MNFAGACPEPFRGAPVRPHVSATGCALDPCAMPFDRVLGDGPLAVAGSQGGDGAIVALAHLSWGTYRARAVTRQRRSTRNTPPPRIPPLTSNRPGPISTAWTPSPPNALHQAAHMCFPHIEPRYHNNMQRPPGVGGPRTQRLATLGLAPNPSASPPGSRLPPPIPPPPPPATPPPAAHPAARLPPRASHREKNGEKRGPGTISCD